RPVITAGLFPVNLISCFCTGARLSSLEAGACRLFGSFKICRAFFHGRHQVVACFCVLSLARGKRPRTSRGWHEGKLPSHQTSQVPGTPSLPILQARGSDTAFGGSCLR